MKKIICIFLCISLCLGLSSISVFANKEDIKSYDIMSLENGTIYYVQTEKSVMCFIEYSDGRIECSTSDILMPNIVRTGFLKNGAKNRYDVNEINEYEILSFLIDQAQEMEPLFVRDFSVNTATRYITTESQALALAASIIPGWETPVTNYNIGGGSYQGINASVKKTIRGDADAVSLIYYYKNEFLSTVLSAVQSSIISALTESPLALADLLNSISWTLDAANNYKASKDGRFYTYKIDNSRTKIATISGSTYYWSGWDYINIVYSGDNGSGHKPFKNMKHADYNNSVSYFVRKAVENYLNE